MTRERFDLHVLTSILKCIDCKGSSFTYYDLAENIGAFVCGHCRCTYFYEDEILDCLPAHLADQQRRNQFIERFSVQLPSNAKTIKIGEDRPEHGFQFESMNSQCYDDLVVESPFWKKINKETLGYWDQKIDPIKNKLILDLGCGTGRVSNWLAEKQIQVIGIDITRSMLEKARSKIEKTNAGSYVSYVLADIFYMPFRDQSFDGLIFFGVFHHLHQPYQAFEQLFKYLKRACFIWGVDNHQSLLRGMFDLLMKLFPAWHEDADIPHTICAQKITDILKRFHFEVKWTSICFIPPHAHRIFPKRIADHIYDFVEWMAHCIPQLNIQGGLFRIEAERSIASKQ